MSKIRLTESQLHRVIKESVNRLLTELNWKTYQNAAKKAKERGDERFDKFEKASDDEFNMRYRPINRNGCKKTWKLSKRGNKLMGDKDDTYYDWDDGVRHDVNQHSEKSYPNGKWNSTYKDIDYFGREDNSAAHYKPYTDMFVYETQPYNTGYARWSRDKFNDADKDLDDYFNGDYEYQKGKGWQLKK